ncbi:MAG: hypothetical protein LWX11_05555 [Firmicutes bacterium]|nr:hypothetical protein [Bacillota bacterium]
MRDPKLIETRGEEPTFIPSGSGESWRRVEFGLGDSPMQVSPEVEASLPPRQRHWGRMIGYALVVTAVVLAASWALSRLF